MFVPPLHDMLSCVDALRIERRCSVLILRSWRYRLFSYWHFDTPENVQQGQGDGDEGKLDKDFPLLPCEPCRAAVPSGKQECGSQNYDDCSSHER